MIVIGDRPAQEEPHRRGPGGRHRRGASASSPWRPTSAVTSGCSPGRARLGAERRFALEDCRHVSGRLERFLLAARRGLRARAAEAHGAGARAALARAARATRSTPRRRPRRPARARPARSPPRRPRARPAPARRPPRRPGRRAHPHPEPPALAPARPRARRSRCRPRRSIAPAGSRASRRRSPRSTACSARIALELSRAAARSRRRSTPWSARSPGAPPSSRPSCSRCPAAAPLTAAHLLGETAGAERFASAARFAMHAGVAPLPVSAGRRNRHRLNRRGNRRLNSALHRIAITQLRMHEPAKPTWRASAPRARARARRCAASSGTWRARSGRPCASPRPADSHACGHRPVDSASPGAGELT